MRARAHSIIDGILHTVDGQYMDTVEAANIYMDNDRYVKVQDGNGDDYVGSEETIEIYLDDEGYGSGSEDD